MIKSCEIQSDQTLTDFKIRSKWVRNEASRSSFGFFPGGSTLNLMSASGVGGSIDNVFMINSNIQVYLFEIEQSELASSNHLRVFVDECDIHKAYTLILYINPISTGSNRQKKKIILDDFNCPIKVYVIGFILVAIFLFSSLIFGRFVSLTTKYSISSTRSSPTQSSSTTSRTPKVHLKARGLKTVTTI